MTVERRGVQTDLTNVIDRNNLAINEILRLIGNHMKFNDLRKFHHPITIDSTSFPACYVQPRTLDPTFEATGLYDYWGEVTIWVYTAGNSIAIAGEDAMATMAIMDKLFSVNALNDLGTPTRSGKYFQNVPFWIESKFGPISYAEPVGFQKDTEKLIVVRTSAAFKYHDMPQP